MPELLTSLLAAAELADESLLREIRNTGAIGTALLLIIFAIIVVVRFIGRPVAEWVKEILAGIHQNQQTQLEICQSQERTTHTQKEIAALNSTITTGQRELAESLERAIERAADRRYRRDARRESTAGGG